MSVRSLAAVAVVWLIAAAPAVAQSAFTPVAGSPFATGDNPLSVSFSPDGKLVAVANSNDNTLSVYSVGARGSLAPVPGSPFPTGRDPMSVAFDPAGPLLAVANTNDGTVSMYAYSGTTVAPIGAFSTGTGTAPQSVAFDSDGNHVVTADFASGQISVLLIGANATLAPVTGSPFTALNKPFALAFDPGTQVFATADHDANKVTLYSLAADGSVLPVAGQSKATGIAPHSVAFSRTGSLLAVADQSDVAVFNDSDSVLTAAGGPSLPPATSPTHVAFSPGSDLLAVGSTAGDAYVFSTPSMTAVAGSPYALATSSPVFPSFGGAGGLLVGLDEFGDQLAVSTVGAPVATIGTAGGVYELDHFTPTSFSCADAPAAPGISSCVDSSGHSGTSGSLDTVSPGRHTYSVTATSLDGQTSTSSISYLVASAPTITLNAPAGHTSYNPNDRTVVSYSCQDGAGGPGIQSCVGTLRNGAALPTKPGSYGFTVTATSRDGLSQAVTVQYTVGEPFALSTAISPTTAGTSAAPAPEAVELTFLLPSLVKNGGFIGDVRLDDPYTLTLPQGFTARTAGYGACDSLRAERKRLPASCSDAVLGSGTLSVELPPSSASGGAPVGCAYNVAVLLLAHPKHEVLRLDAERAGSSADCPSRPVLVDIRIGASPATLTFQLPESVVGNSSASPVSTSATQVNGSLFFPIARSGRSTRSYFASTGCDRRRSGPGFAWIFGLSVGTSLSTSATTTCAPAGADAVTTARGRSQSVTGTVVHLIKKSSAFVVARADGKLYKIATPSPLPAIGTQVTVGIRPLIGGQWAQTCLTTQGGSAVAATMKGTVTFRLRARREFVLTAGGSSILLKDSGRLPPLLHNVTVHVDINGSALTVEMVTVGGLHKGKLVISGILEKLVKHKLHGGSIATTYSFSPDDGGGAPAQGYTLNGQAPDGLSAGRPQRDPFELIFDNPTGKGSGIKSKPSKIVLDMFKGFGATAEQLCTTA